MIKITNKGDFSKTYAFLKHAKNVDLTKKLSVYGREGVAALAAATPVDTGKTAASWDYKISRTKDTFTITWTNSNTNQGVPIVVLLQYGHATRGGGYVIGRDFINPAIQPIFDKIANEAWKEVIRG